LKCRRGPLACRQSDQFSTNDSNHDHAPDRRFLGTPGAKKRLSRNWRGPHPKTAAAARLPMRRFVLPHVCTILYLWRGLFVRVMFYYRALCSIPSRFLFRSMPQRYPPMLPSSRTTRWHGIATATGFVAQARATARAAVGRPIPFATSL